MIERLQSALVDDWRSAWRWSSVRFHAILVLIAALYEVMPALDPQLAAVLPEPMQAKAVGLYALIGLVLRLTKLKRDARP